MNWFLQINLVFTNEGIVGRKYCKSNCFHRLALHWFPFLSRGQKGSRCSEGETRANITTTISKKREYILAKSEVEISPISFFFPSSGGKWGVEVT